MAMSLQSLALPAEAGRSRALTLLLRLGGLGLVLAAALALVAGAMGPLWFKLDAFAHLRIQFSLLALLGALLIGLSGAWRGAALTSIVGLSGLVSLGPIWDSPRALAAHCVAEEFTVVTANVHDTNKDFDALVAALLAQDADFIATQESVGRFWRASGPLKEAYPYRVNRFSEGARTWRTMFWSKRPAHALRISDYEKDTPALAGAIVKIGGREATIAGVHVVRPVIGPQESQLRGVAGVFDGAPAPRVVMGDFNATPWSWAMTIAQESVGAAIAPGFRLTWHGRYPNPFDRKKGWKPPSVIGNQIDHVLVSPQIGVKEIRTFDLPGSVHRGVFARLQLSSGAPGCP